LDYYADEKKLFLTELHEQIEETGRTSADTLIVKKLLKHEDQIRLVGVDAPLKLPKCVRCKLTCPGHEKCHEPEIDWMWKQHRKRSQVKRPNKIFTPYTERCVDFYVGHEISPEVNPGHAMGSNRAPLMARALYIRRRVPQIKWVETYPRLSLWQLGQELGLRKIQYTGYRSVTEGEELRAQILERWSEQGLSFIYHRDLKHMIKDVYAFEAFLSAYTAFLADHKLCQPKPEGFPKAEAWLAFPQPGSLKKLSSL
jgi:predicted nuclease with RNAse H fold